VNSSGSGQLVAVLGTTVKADEFKDSVLGLALRRYVYRERTEGESATNGYSDHKDYHDHSDCICVIGGL